MFTLSEILPSALSAVPTSPLALPSCSFALVSAPTSERTRCATAKAPPSSVASATRKPVEMRFCDAWSSVLVVFSEDSATCAPMFVLTELSDTMSCLSLPLPHHPGSRTCFCTTTFCGLTASWALDVAKR